MKIALKHYLLAVLLTSPFLGGCMDDSDSDSSVPALGSNAAAAASGKGADEGRDSGDQDEGRDGDNSADIITLFDRPANGDPLEIDDREALLASIEATFGMPGDEPREPGEVLDLNDDNEQ